MILCLDIGNSQIYAGVFKNDELILRFRHSSLHPCSSDQIGIFLKSALRENGVDASKITAISICSVVPNMDYSIRSACMKYFSIEPFFLTAKSNKLLNLQYENPSEIGSDRIANAMAAAVAYPNQDIIIVDFGTATTYCAVNKNKDYLGGIIQAGIRLAMEALQSKTANLFPVEIVRPKTVIGKSTRLGIQSGLYYSQLASIKEITQRIIIENYHNQETIIIGTGGFAHLFQDEGIFTEIDPDLVFKGLKLALEG